MEGWGEGEEADTREIGGDQWIGGRPNGEKSTVSTRQGETKRK